MHRVPFLASVLALAGTTIAQTCTSTIAATSCGPTLTATFTPVGNSDNQRITLTAQGLDPNGIGIMTWGQQLVNIPFPTCPMLNDSISSELVNIDATGSVTWSRVWPATANTFYYVQFGSVVIDPATGAFVLLTTDSLRVECT